MDVLVEQTVCLRSNPSCTFCKISAAVVKGDVTAVAELLTYVEVRIPLCALFFLEDQPLDFAGSRMLSFPAWLGPWLEEPRKHPLPAMARDVQI